MLEDQKIESVVDTSLHSKSVEVTPIKLKFMKSRAALYQEPETVILSHTQLLTYLAIRRTEGGIKAM